MTAPMFHPKEALPGLVDGRLEAAQQRDVEAHVAECAECRRDLALLAAARDGIRAAYPRTSASAGDAAFEARLRAAFDREDRTPSARRRVVTVFAAAAAVVLAVFFAAWWLRSPAPSSDLVAEAVREFGAARGESLVLERETERPDELEGYFAARLEGFPVRVLDLGMMGWRLRGGRVHRIGGQPSALYVYRDGNGRVLVCQMFLGRLEELPAGGERFARGAISFAVHERNGVTAVFWDEGKVLCVLVSDLPRAEVIALATAKAMAARGSAKQSEPRRPWRSG